ncbi:kelch-like protein 33 [Sarotherodon galilaeus]
MRWEAPEPAGSSWLQEGVKPAAVVQTSPEYSELMQLSNNDSELVHQQLLNFQNKSKGFLQIRDLPDRLPRKHQSPAVKGAVV